jgi:hypothetical protein
MSFEVLDCALVLLGGRTRLKGAQISAPFGFRVELARVQPIFTRSELAYHSPPRPGGVSLNCIF